MIASTDRTAFLAANRLSPVVCVRYRERPKNGRSYRLKDGKTFILDEKACVDLPELWPDDFI